MSFWSWGLVRSRYKLKSLYIHCKVPMATKLGRLVTYQVELPPTVLLYPLVSCSKEIIYGHKTWQDSNLPQFPLTHKVKWPYDHLVLRYHVTMEKHISTATMLMTTKLGKMITYLEWLIPIKSHNCIITWNRKIKW